MIEWIGWLNENSEQATAGIQSYGKRGDRYGCNQKLCHAWDARNPDHDGNEKEAKKHGFSRRKPLPSSRKITLDLLTACPRPLPQFVPDSEVVDAQCVENI